MKHASTRAVFTYWESRRRGRPAPARNEIDPASIRQALGDAFMLSAEYADDLHFRLAGTRVCALFCREIKGALLPDLWAAEDEQSLAELVAMVRDEAAPIAMGVTGHNTAGAAADLEMLLLPLARNGSARTGMLGVLAPLAPIQWIGTTPIVALRAKTFRHLGREAARPAMSAPLAVTAGSRWRHGFKVYDGGRAGIPR